MIYQLSLQFTGVVTGLLLTFYHSVALLRERQAIFWAKAFPRSRASATVLLAIAAIWSFLLVRKMDLGEFSHYRTLMLFGIAIGAVLSWFYVEEFLAVRALGILLLLAAEPLLESAFLRNEATRLLLVILAYVWAISGLFLVSMPYLLRDFINWAAAKPVRWRIGCLVGLGWGLAILACAIFVW